MIRIVTVVFLLVCSGVAVGDSVTLCHDCELIIGSFSNFLLNPYFQRAVEAFVEKDVCKNLPPGQVQQSCDQFVVGFVPTMFEYLVNKLSPVSVCGDIQLCNNQTASYHGYYTVQLKEPKLSVTTDCEYCETAVLAVRDYITQSMDKIETFLNYACDILPYGEQCHEIVKQYLADIIQQIEVKFLNPSQVCQSLKFCPSPSQVLVM